MYTDLNKVYTSEMKCEVYSIDTIRLTEEQVGFERTRNFRNYWLIKGLKADFDYVRLIKNGEGVMMSDTPMERNTNAHFVRKANGDVLIFGLGLGLVILPLLESEDVKSVTVVELHQELIDFVEPILKNHDPNSKLRVVQGDCFEYHKTLDKSVKFDCVYGDIWISIDVDNYEEMKQLTKNWKYRINRSNPNCFIDHWMKEFLLDEIRRDRY